MDLNTRVDNLERQLSDLQDLYNKLNFPDNQAYDKNLTSNILFTAGGNGIRLVSKSNPNGIEIRTGSAGSDSGIKAEVGYTSPNGSIYFTSQAFQQVWIMVSSTWTLLTIP